MTSPALAWSAPRSSPKCSDKLLPTTRSRVRRVAFGDGYEQRLAFGINTQPQLWSLEFRGRTSLDAAAIDAFLRARGPPY